MRIFVRTVCFAWPLPMNFGASEFVKMQGLRDILGAKRERGGRTKNKRFERWEREKTRESVKMKRKPKREKKREREHICHVNNTLTWPWHASIFPPFSLNERGREKNIAFFIRGPVWHSSCGRRRIKWVLRRRGERIYESIAQRFWPRRYLLFSICGKYTFEKEESHE